MVIALRPDRTLRVLVVDAGARPVAGAHLMLRRDGAKEDFVRLGETDKAGRHDSQHCQQYASTDAAPTVLLRASFGGGDSAQMLVDVIAPPPEVVLKLPPGGVVTVVVLDADGKPLETTYLGNPSATMTSLAERPQPNTDSGISNRVSSSLPLDAHSKARFEPVAFDRFVMAQVGGVLRSEFVPGPTPSEPHLTITVREAGSDTVVTGTLLDAAGNALASADYFLTAVYRSGMSGQNGRTDAAGRFRIGFGRIRSETAALSFDTKFANRDAPLAAELPVRTLTPGRNDVGEVRLAPHGILLQGRVELAAGGIASPPPLQLDVERQLDQRWQQIWNLQPEWDAGTVTIRSGIAKGTPLRLTIRADGFLPVAPIECAAGDTGLVIPLRTGGSVRATFLVDATLPIARLTMRLRGKNQTRDPRGDLLERLRNTAGAPPPDGRWSGSGRDCSLAPTGCRRCARALRSRSWNWMASKSATDRAPTFASMRSTCAAAPAASRSAPPVATAPRSPAAKPSSWSAAPATNGVASTSAAVWSRWEHPARST
ncbi:MAG: hypothetical protein WAT39_25690 [Planctomycetota bacterium]